MVKVKIINNSKNKMPAYATPGSAGMDIRADFSRIHTLEDMTIYGHCAYNATHGFVMQPGARALIPTGIHIGLPEGYECQVRSRSGLALKHGITVLNSPGTIDADYIGEIGVILINHGMTPFKIENGDRIAQIVITKCEQCEWEPVDKLKETERGEGGYNHTGVK